MGTVQQAKAIVGERIDVHLDLNATYRAERGRVALGEMNGLADPETIAKVEESLSRVYALQYESAELLASVSAKLADITGEFNGQVR
jgi:hypothetical protein